MKNFLYRSMFSVFGLSLTWIVAICLLSCPEVSSAFTPTVGNGRYLTVSANVSDTLKVVAMAIQQKESGSFVTDSTTPIVFSLRSPDYRYFNTHQLAISYHMRASGTNLDSAQFALKISYCFTNITGKPTPVSISACPVYSRLTDSTHTNITTFVTSANDTGWGTMLLNVPEGATSVSALPATTIKTCSLCTITVSNLTANGL